MGEPRCLTLESERGLRYTGRGLESASRPLLVTRELLRTLAGGVRGGRSPLRLNSWGPCRGPHTGDIMPSFKTRLSPALIDRYMRSGHWGRETFYSILASRANAHPDRVAVIADRGRVAYRELRGRIHSTADALPQLASRPCADVTRPPPECP